MTDSALRDLLTGLPLWRAGARDRRAFLEMALPGHPALLDFQYEGSPQTVASELVTRLYPACQPLADGTHPVAALIREVRAREEDANQETAARISALEGTVDLSARPGLASPRPPIPDQPAAPPASADAGHQRLADELDAARAEEERRLCADEDTREVRALILDLRRRIREGGALCPGYDLLAGRYRLIGRVGQGGFATIWKAFDRQLRRTVALKVLHHQYAHDGDRVERFFRGARKMADLHHPGIVRVHDSDLTDERHRFFVMDYLPGGDLRRAVLDGTLRPERVPDLILAVGDALAYAHGRGVIHRDVKPANIVLDGEGRPQLTDFDLVRAADTTGGTRTSMMGTFVYAAPELMENPQDADARADGFGLAMTAIFMLYGRDLAPKDLLRHPEVFIGRLAVAESVRAVLARAIEWDLGERYPTVEDFCAAFAGAWRSGVAAVVRDRLKDGSEGPEMVWLPAGTFLMGSPKGEGSAFERPQHEVRIGRPFAIGRFPVTFEEYDRYCVAVGLKLPADQGWGRGRRPVINVSWDQAVDYCAWLSGQTGRAYRLPSEAEWEYACRAGTRTRWSFGDDDKALGEHAWFNGNSGGQTHPVGEKQPNPWGLYDMHGNVWEWVQDHWHDNYQGAPDDGRAWEDASGGRRVLRGGSWFSGAVYLRCACRSRGDPGYRNHDTGFRLALGPEPGQSGW